MNLNVYNGGSWVFLILYNDGSITNVFFSKFNSYSVSSYRNKYTKFIYIYNSKSRTIRCCVVQTNFELKIIVFTIPNHGPFLVVIQIWLYIGMMSHWLRSLSQGTSRSRVRTSISLLIYIIFIYYMSFLSPQLIMYFILSASPLRWGNFILSNEYEVKLRHMRRLNDVLRSQWFSW